METLVVDNKHFVHTNMFEDICFSLTGASWELEEELEKLNIRIEWQSNDQGNKTCTINNDSKMGLIDEKNTEVKEYKCDVCFKVLSHQGNLKTHMKVHAGVKEFQCSVCLKEFTQRGNLNTYMK